MADDAANAPAPATATQSTPWFAVTSNAQGSGQSLTTQRTALNEQVTGVANDLGAGLTAILAAINAKPSAT